jgi:AmmeMemoRadiSam system protein B
LKYRQNEDDMQKLILALQSISSKNILLVASVDFSHYLSSDIASSKDAETQKYFQNHDYKRIEALSSDYIDSPWTLITFLKYLEQNGLSEGRELSHTNTGKLAGQTIESSTSFFTYIFK